MGETGCRWYDGKQIPVMNLSTKVIRCDLYILRIRACVCAATLSGSSAEEVMKSGPRDPQRWGGARPKITLWPRYKPS
jgi:hypothetical protein